MKKTIIALLLTIMPALSLAAGGHVHLDQANIKPGDEESLRRGAKLFVNYCLSCHSAKYRRYNRMGSDLGLTETMVEDNLIFTDSKVGGTMDIAMQSDNASTWFGTAAPDLSVVARSRSVDWLYTYLRSFYVDNSRPFGVNNTAFPDVAMPHVLWELQGLQKLNNPDEAKHGHAPEFEQVSQGSMTPKEYDDAVRDLVNYLNYMAEPNKQYRLTLGVYVILFLLLFTFVAYLLKKEYWKDVH
jgi:ubiquinol-cytochrome c reductase cytochrome c1 subunit